MYQGGMVAKQEADKRADAELLGEKQVALQAVEEQSKVTFQHYRSELFLLSTREFYSPARLSKGLCTGAGRADEPAAQLLYN